MSAVRLAALPESVRVDEDVRVRAEGIARDVPVIVSLANAGAPGSVLLARAEFLASEGDIDLARDAPLSGSYVGVDAMGLFWSRTPHPAADVPPQVQVAVDPMTVTLTVQAGGEVLSHAIRRYFLSPEEVRLPLPRRQAGTPGLACWRSLATVCSPGRENLLLGKPRRGLRGWLVEATAAPGRKRLSKWETTSRLIETR